MITLAAEGASESDEDDDEEEEDDDDDSACFLFLFLLRTGAFPDAAGAIGGDEGKLDVIDAVSRDAASTVWSQPRSTS